MTETPNRGLGRPPKLRSSCDGCGASKLKCDRRQPECERCLSIGLACVYSPTRKMGKPPKRRAQITVPSTPVDTSSDSRTRDDLDHNAPAANAVTPSALNAVLAQPVWDTVNGNTSSHGHLASSTPPGTLPISLGPPPPDFESSEFVEDLMSLDLDPTLPLSTLGTETHVTGLFANTGPPNRDLSHGSELDDRLFSSATTAPVDSPSHNCLKEAFETLGTLSLFDYSPAPSFSQPTPGSTPTLTTMMATSPWSRVPLDHVLRMNREANERLGRLISCPCANCPHLAFLYASIISRVLLWYQEAAVDSQGAAVPSAETAFHDAFTSTSGSTMHSAPWGSTAAGTSNNGGASSSSVNTSSEAATTSVTPTWMTMGNFSVDDQQVQMAMRIQLLLGEVRRTGFLVELFTSRSFGGMDDLSFTGVDNLYKSLSSWLRREHSRVADMMRCRLKELSS